MIISHKSDKDIEQLDIGIILIAKTKPVLLI